MGLMAANEGRALDNQRTYLACNGSNKELFRGLNHSDGRPAHGRTRAHLRNGASRFALSVASTIVALGVCTPDDASAQTTVNPVQTTTFTLTAAQNPIIFGSATNIDTTAINAADAVSGAAGTAWDVSNQGTVKGNYRGFFLDGAGSTFTNSGAVTQTSNLEESGRRSSQKRRDRHQSGGRVDYCFQRCRWIL